MRHVDHCQPPAGAQDTLELLENDRKVSLRQQIEHVVVDQNIETVVRKRQLIRVAHTQPVTVDPGLGSFLLRAHQHGRRQVDPLVMAGWIGLEDLHESQPCPDRNLQYVLAIADGGQPQAALPGVSLCQPAPDVIERGDPAVDIRNPFLFDLRVKHSTGTFGPANGCALASFSRESASDRKPSF